MGVAAKGSERCDELQLGGKKGSNALGSRPKCRSLRRGRDFSTVGAAVQQRSQWRTDLISLTAKASR